MTILYSPAREKGRIGEKNEREKGRERERERKGEEGIGDDRGDVCSVTQSRQQ